MRKKKSKPVLPLNTRIYKKICELVRIEEVKDEEGQVINYLVQSKRTKKDEWNTISETISLKKAIQKKHFQVLIAIRDLGYRPDFLAKRKKRK